MYVSISHVYIYICIYVYRDQLTGSSNTITILICINMHRKHQNPLYQWHANHRFSHWPEQKSMAISRFRKAQKSSGRVLAHWNWGTRGVLLSSQLASLEFKLLGRSFDESCLCILDVPWLLACRLWFTFLWKTISHHPSNKDVYMYTYRIQVGNPFAPFWWCNYMGWYTYIGNPYHFCSHPWKCPFCSTVCLDSEGIFGLTVRISNSSCRHFWRRVESQSGGLAASVFPCMHSIWW